MCYSVNLSILHLFHYFIIYSFGSSLSIIQLSFGFSSSIQSSVVYFTFPIFPPHCRKNIHPFVAWHTSTYFYIAFTLLLKIITILICCEAKKCIGLAKVINLVLSLNYTIQNSYFPLIS